MCGIWLLLLWLPLLLPAQIFGSKGILVPIDASGRVLDQAIQTPIPTAYDLPMPEDQVAALSHRLRIAHPDDAPSHPDRQSSG